MLEREQPWGWSSEHTEESPPEQLNYCLMRERNWGRGGAGAALAPESWTGDESWINDQHWQPQFGSVPFPSDPSLPLAPPRLCLACTSSAPCSPRHSRPASICAPPPSWPRRQRSSWCVPRISTGVAAGWGMSPEELWEQCWVLGV